jgi:hypothetical protein
MSGPCEQVYILYLYQYIKGGWIHVSYGPAGSEAPKLTDFARVSGPVTVKFPKLSLEEGVTEALRALDEAELKAREELQRTLSDLKDKRAVVMQLRYEPKDSFELPKDDMYKDNIPF